jgi:hypothetical protein
MTSLYLLRPAGLLAVLSAALLGTAVAVAQTPSKPDVKADAPQAAEPGPLAPLAWLDGCWRGSVNGREFREHWMPLRGNLLIGVSQTVLKDKTQDFEYLRVEPRDDGVYYVILPPNRSESAYKLTGQPAAPAADGKEEEYVFTNPALEFPKKITYRRGKQGWLYATVAGTVKGADREITYPMRRIDCQSGELILR